MNKKHFCIVGEGRPVHKKLKDMGALLTLFIKNDCLHHGDSALYDSIHSFAKTDEHTKWADVAGVIHQHQPFDKILCVDEESFEQYKAITQHLEIEVENITVMENVTYKEKARQLLHDSNIDDSRFFYIDDKAKINPGIAYVGFPLIVKPVNGQASEGVKMFTEQQQAKAIEYIEKGLNQGSILIEQFWVGSEYSIETLSENGEHFILGITKAYEDDVTFVETGHCFPAHDLTDREVEQVKHFVSRSLTALGIKNGAGHTEVILSKGAPRFVETHTRCGGDQIVDLVKAVTGLDMFTLWCEQLLGNSIADKKLSPSSYGAYAAIQFLYSDKPGRLNTIQKGLVKPNEGRFKLKVEALKAEGEELKTIEKVGDRLASAIAIDSDGEAALQQAREALDKFEYSISTL
ncbi:ATP-grasp domain-containing protein [Pseudoalteromonas sp. ASV78]|uniref:ATP-grasp domain-containing protein n=1 Tax=Pseudoalteromonas sp. ASV78 TaxID=3397851 RepID=UPI0039FC66F4